MIVRAISGTMRGQSVNLRGSITIGRNKCSLTFPDDSKGVSRIHCRIDENNGYATITDLGSSYGTFVNGNRIVANVPTDLFDGDSFYLGDARNSFLFQLEPGDSKAKRRTGNSTHVGRKTVNLNLQNNFTPVLIVAAVLIVIFGFIMFNQKMENKALVNENNRIQQENVQLEHKNQAMEQQNQAMEQQNQAMAQEMSGMESDANVGRITKTIGNGLFKLIFK